MVVRGVQVSCSLAFSRIDFSGIRQVYAHFVGLVYVHCIGIVYSSSVDVSGAVGGDPHLWILTGNICLERERSIGPWYFPSL